MAMLVLVVLIVAFFAGFVLVCMGIVGKDPQGFWSLPIDLEHPGPEHPPERHRLRLFLTGVALMAVAAVLAAVVA